MKGAWSLEQGAGLTGSTGGLPGGGGVPKVRCMGSGKAFIEEGFDLIQEGRPVPGQFLKTWQEGGGGGGQAAPTCHCEN